MAKNTKQSNQKKSVLNKLGGLSKRSKFIVVVLIFAVLGGGYLTYKSFAATAGPAPIVTVAENMFVKGCTSNKVQDPGKNNLVVMNIACPPKRGWVASNVYRQNMIFWPSGTYKVCVLAKGVGKFRISQGGNVDFNGLGSKNYDINDSTYKEYCSDSVTMRSGQVFDEVDSGDIRSIDGSNNSATLLTIRSMTKRWYAPGVAPAPSGGK
jgi:hypothetical protein